MELNENYEDSITINISFKGKTEKVQCNYYMNFEEVIKKFLKKYKNIKFSPDKIIIRVNENQCFLEEILEMYKEEINNNSIFQLKYKSNSENEPNELNINENWEKDIQQEEIEIIKNEFYLLNEIKHKRDYQIFIPREPKPIITKETNKFDFEINIKFIKTYKNIFKQKINSNLFGILKLCLLKEIALLIDLDNINYLPDYISNIMTIL